MAQQLQLIPELQQLIDDFISVRQRFTDLAAAFAAQKTLLERQNIELENATAELSAMKQKQTENEAIVKSYNELKLDYEFMHSEAEKQREEIRAENKTHVRELEEALKEARVKASEQAELHQNRVTQIIADYEGKLRDADEKNRQLSRVRNDTPKTDVYDYDDIYSPVSIRGAKAPRGGNKRWPKLDVAIDKPKVSGTRGRGNRSRGGPSKRKLFKLSDGKPIDLE